MIKWLTGERLGRLAALARDVVILTGAAAVDVGLLHGATYRLVAQVLAALSGS